MDAVLETDDLSRRFGRHWAVDGVSLRVPRGSIYGFLGLNGAGKTTTLRMVLGLLKPSRGGIRWFGGGVSLREARGRVGAMVEGPAFFGELSGFRNLQRLGALSERPSRTRVGEVLDRVGLTDAAHRRASQYSLGMKQRLAIALALISRPEVVVLDEPTNGLDPNGILEMRKLVRSLNEDDGVTFLVSSHLLHEVEQLCTCVGILEAGALVVEQSLADLRDELSVRYILHAAPSERIEPVLLSSGATDMACDNGVWSFDVHNTKRLPSLHRALVEAGVEVQTLEARRTTLEEHFLARSSSRDAGRLT